MTGLFSQQDGSAEDKLWAARQAAQSGQRQRAYQLSLEATNLAPDNVEAWFFCAALTNANEERLSALSKVLSLDPEHASARRDMYETLDRYRKQDPFLRYLGETETLYRVITGEGQFITVPKDRAVDASPNESGTLHSAYRWIGYSLAGLLLAGLGAMVCAPIAAALAWRAGHEAPGAEIRRRASLMLVAAIVMWAIGLLLSCLFLLHL